jgi:hypothetical protein
MAFFPWEIANVIKQCEKPVEEIDCIQDQNSEENCLTVRQSDGLAHVDGDRDLDFGALDP